MTESTLCVWKVDGTGKEMASIFWMLRDEGVSAETNDKLVAGTYECFAGVPNQYTFMDLRIVSEGVYEWAGEKGKYRADPTSRKIVYDSGPLTKATSKLLAGPSVGLNLNGGTFFGTHCDLKKK